MATLRIYRQAIHSRNGCCLRDGLKQRQKNFPEELNDFSPLLELVTIKTGYEVETLAGRGVQLAFTSNRACC